MKDQALKIGQLAERAGVTVPTLRFYERKGLVPAPPRDDGNNYRTYTAEDLEAVAAVKRAQALGFRLREVRELVGLRLRRAGAAHARLLELATAKLAELDAEAERIQRARRVLRGLLRACDGHGDVGTCALREHLVGGARR